MTNDRFGECNPLFQSPSPLGALLVRVLLSVLCPISGILSRSSIGEICVCKSYTSAALVKRQLLLYHFCHGNKGGREVEMKDKQEAFPSP